MKEVGYLTFIDDDDDKLVIYSDDFVNFYDKNGKILNKEKELKKWAIWINSPWLCDSFEYIISFNSEKYWKCKYLVCGYDYIQSAIFGFGDTPEEAIANCQSNFKKLQEKYNPDDISV